MKRLLQRFGFGLKVAFFLFGVGLLLAGASLVPGNILLGSVATLVGMLLMAVSA